MPGPAASTASLCEGSCLGASSSRWRRRCQRLAADAVAANTADAVDASCPDANPEGEVKELPSSSESEGEEEEL